LLRESLKSRVNLARIAGAFDVEPEIERARAFV
jgi:hypothetical protein